VLNVVVLKAIVLRAVVLLKSVSLLSAACFRHTSSRAGGNSRHYTWGVTPAFLIDPYDLLRDRLRFALERVAKSDIDNRDGDAVTIRLDAHAGLREIGVETAAAGFNEAALYEFLINSEEARIDFENEQADE